MPGPRIVTGASSGLGQNTAALLLDRGWNVTAMGRRRERLEALATSRAEGFGDRADRLLVEVGDLSADEVNQRAVRNSVRKFGRIDAVVCSARCAADGWLEDGDPAALRHMILTNVAGPALLLHHARAQLSERHGRAVLVGSVAGMVPTPANLYGVTKWAVTAMAENARRMLTDSQVSVTLFAPGRMDTEFFDDIGGQSPELPYLDPEHMAGQIAWVLDQPADVDVNVLAVRPFRSPI